jgi:predicted nucleotidyltransferase
MINIKQKILKFLIENKERSFSINGISKSLKIDYKLVYMNIKKLGNENAVKIEDLGNVKRCSFDNYFNNDVFIVENERKKEILKNKDFLVTYNELSKINKQFILLLFGSHIKGTASKNSDIDLLLISSKEEAKLVESELKMIPLKIHLTSISYEDFIEMLKTKEQTVVNEALKKNIILYGLEDYYRLLKNAR